ncbi:Nrap protein [Backusella circina FSU 941]|nr:Nrap protein [Backusella circina FSU 941]
MAPAVKRKFKNKNANEPSKKAAKNDRSNQKAVSDDDMIEDDGEDLVAASTGNAGFSEEEENGDWESGSDDDDEDEGLPTIDKKLSNKKTEDDIISGELEGLKETAELFKSNIFKLEIDELLAETSIQYDKHKALEKALHYLKELFDNIPDGKPAKFHDFAKQMQKKQKIVTPFPDPQPAADALNTFTFEKPASLRVVGGYGLKSISKSKKGFNVDVAVEMPASIFQDKDYSNYRYHHKRACYLAVLAGAIKASKKNKFDIEYSTLNGDLRRPILLVKPINDKSNMDFTKTKCVIRILPSVNAEIFPIHRLAPGKSNVKTSQDPTPHYNASLLVDTSYSSNLAFLYQHSKNSPEFKNAILLARTWIYQRGLKFSPFLFSMLMAYLIQGKKDGTGKKLSASHSSYQLLRGTLDFIATHDFEETPVFIGQSDKPEFSAEEFAQYYDVAIVDPSGTLNLAANLTTSDLEQVKHEAQLALTYFNDPTDRFEALFLKKVDDITCKFDNIVRIPLPAATAESFVPASRADYHSYLAYFAKQIGKTLKRGLTNRANLVAVEYDYPTISWKVDTAIPDVEKDSLVTVGLLLNSDNAPRLVDQGPDAQDAEGVAEFRQFWGKKSELRRFKDGAIVESVVWQTQGYEHRSLIVQKIVLYLLQTHFQLAANDLHYWAGQLYSYLNFAKCVPPNLFTPALKTNGFQNVMAAFSQFSKQLREVDDALPLLINNVYPASSALRYSTVTVPHPVDFGNMSAYPTTTRYFDAIDVVVHLERSSKFPDDLAALQKVKDAFYLKMADELHSRYEVQATVVNDVREKNPYAIRSYLDVYYYGYVFRCHICLDQEEDRLKYLVGHRDTTKLDKGLLKSALEKFSHQLKYSSNHTFYIQAVCAKYTAYSSTVRLVKRWVGAHMLSRQVSEEMLELLVAHVFLEPQPWSAPVSTLSGFTRSLNLLASWDWQNSPLIVDIEGELTTKDRETIMEKFNVFRSQNPQISHGAMTIATAKDLDGHRWTDKKPSKVIAARIQALAKASIQAIQNAVHTNHHSDINSVFVTPMQGYSAILNLNVENCTRYYQNMHPNPKYLQRTASELGDRAFAQFDPIADFITDIETIYGDTLMVFYNKYGGDKLALVWNPAVATPMQWKVQTGYNSVPVDMNKNGFLKPAKGSKEVSKLIEPNFDAILAEIQRLGRDDLLKA